MRITKKWKNIISIGLAVLVLFGAVGAVAVFSTNDSKPAGAVFKVGGLDPVTGKYVKTDKTIYTETAIDAYGLRIEPDFEAMCTYDVYLYNEDDILISNVLGITEVYSNNLEHAEFARIVIHPEIPEDVKEKDFKINFFDIAKYASQLDITVSKDVSKYGNFDNLYRDDLTTKGSKLLYNTENGDISNSLDFESTDASYFSSVRNIKVTGEYEYYDVFIYVEESASSEIHKFGIFEGEGSVALVQGKVDTFPMEKPVWAKITLKVPELDSYENTVISGNFVTGAKIYIYGYND